ncbi:MAG: M20/M25/M40 family metallo-hydrolase [Bacteriovoracaceae bacterium]|nr:M20/M25/M40 family metallo-hydrolase [Bacteroidota bacterium]
MKPYFCHINVLLRYCNQIFSTIVASGTAVLLFVSFTHAQPVLNAISPDSIRTHLFLLGDDAFEGRGTGSQGCERAAFYIAGKLKLYGINPPSSMADYFQSFPLHGSAPMEETEFKLFAPKDSYTLRLQEDYVLYSAGAQTFIPTSVRLVFVGYGIVAPEYDYNDYQSVDVTNAIVVFLSGEPDSEDDSYFDGKRPTVHSSFVVKQKTAFARGAKGSILIASPSDRSMDDWYEQQRHFLFEEVRLLYAPSENLNILLNAKLAPFLFTDALYSYTDVVGFEKKRTMKSFVLTLRAAFQGKFRERDFLSSNIIGMIEGSDPVLKNSYLLLSAHYDHLGIGPAVEGDSIYNGAFDNASGVAALLEIARTMVQSAVRPKRSLLFVFVTGEERGFLGSQYYCLNPTVPLHKTIANINIDGISLFENIHSVIGVGAELSTLGTRLKQSMKPAKILVEEIPSDLFRLEQFRNSDQFMFAQAGIPSILITEGLHYEHSSASVGIARYISWSEDRYHTPFDDLTQTMDFQAASQHTALIRQFAFDLANGSSEPSWYARTPFQSARVRSFSEKR